MSIPTNVVDLHELRHENEEYDLNKQPNFFAFAAAAAQQQYGYSGLSHHPHHHNNIDENIIQGIQDYTTIRKPMDSEEHARHKKENHKEVERRRRETINIGIQTLAEIIPCNEKNKARILQSAAIYITELQKAETTNVEKWTLEKILFEKAIHEYQKQIVDLKAENAHLRKVGDQYIEGSGNKRQRHESGLHALLDE
jgi:hypothetical protein